MLKPGNYEPLNSSNAMKSVSALLLLLLTFFAVERANAQIQVDLELDRKLWVQHEPITGELTIVNRAGQDVILGDTDGMSWLDFSVTDGRGYLITPVRNHLNERPIVLSAGQTYKHDVTINKYYPMATIGVYRVKATVTFPQINRVFQTPVVSVQVTQGQPIWSQIVGVPQGHPKAGTYREYSLMTFYHGARSKALYFSLKDSDSGMVYKTYPLGDYMTVRPPQHAIDQQNRLHVLHMSGPQRYKYSIIGVDGDPISQQTFFEKNGNRPEIKSNDFGEVAVSGGFTESEMETPYEEAEFRRLSERPPGLPNF
ncbi:MAG: hypothetical protein CMO55_14925 [Verrucomicrobiales bacterium]|nr:hypothetical protein [Verrucomicrobiales bacterium]